MLSEGVFEPSRLSIPQANTLVITPRCERFAIRAERHARDRMRMSGESAFEPSRLSIPQANTLVITPRCECDAIWTKRHAGDRMCVSGEHVFGASCPLPSRAFTPFGRCCREIFSAKVLCANSTNTHEKNKHFFTI